MGGPLPLALALLAVLTLIALAHLLGFSRPGRLSGPDHAAALAQSLPGGFTPSAITVARDGSGALLRDAQGRVAIIAPVGAHFLARAAVPGWLVSRAGDGRLHVRGNDFTAMLDLGPATDDWLVSLTPAVGEDA